MLNVFFVDDDEDDIFLFDQAIKTIDRPLNIYYAKNSVELFECLDRISPGIIFMDINLPGYNGVECLKRIRSDERYDRIVVIMRSTTGTPFFIDECYRLGAHYYIIKARSLKVMIERFKILLSVNWATAPRPSREDFVISGD